MSATMAYYTSCPLTARSSTRAAIRSRGGQPTRSSLRMPSLGSASRSRNTVGQGTLLMMSEPSWLTRPASAPAEEQNQRAAQRCTGQGSTRPSANSRRTEAEASLEFASLLTPDQTWPASDP